MNLKKKLFIVPVFFLFSINVLFPDCPQPITSIYLCIEFMQSLGSRLEDTHLSGGGVLSTSQEMLFQRVWVVWGEVERTVGQRGRGAADLSPELASPGQGLPKDHSEDPPRRRRSEQRKSSARPRSAAGAEAGRHPRLVPSAGDAK